MSFFTEGQLRSFATSSALNESSGRFVKAFESLARVSIFLSHSHDDKELARGLKNHLASFGINLYIDWEDTDMPEITSRETAEKIKARIGKMQIFLLLATERALKSRWVPWEVGVADTLKRPDNILVVPVADSTGKFSGNEYLQLYKRLIIADNNQSAIFQPNKTTGGVLLREWLS